MQKTISLLKQSLTSLYDSCETDAIVSLLLEEVCGITRVDMIMNPDKKIDDAKAQLLAQYAQRLSQGEPVQYVLGYEYFMGEKFQVNPDVLIPRPETSELVDWIVENYVEKSRKTVEKPVYNILDIGTGSGCIAISLARLINNSTVFAFDISTGALKTAKANAEAQNINNIQFCQVDILNTENSAFRRVRK